jgi:GNAT superfamily N-acetyltransferase
MADPRDFSCTDTLKNGLAVTIRHLRPDDRVRMARAIGELDRESIYTRLFSYRELTEAGLDRVMRFDPGSEVALVVTTTRDGAEAVIGGGRYVVTGTGDDGRQAEVAFVVEEDYQGQGIAGKLLRHLAAIARDQGIAAFEADVLAENASMLVVFAKAGLPMRKRKDGGTVHVTMSLRDGAT